MAGTELTRLDLYRCKEEAKLDSEVDALLEPDVTNDSIMDDEPEESEEDEVNSILASDEDEQ